MKEFDVAHIREQGQDMIIIPLSSDYGQKPDTEKEDVLHSLQAYATAAGLAGSVVTVWDAGGGRMGFMGPRPWHPFLASIGLHQVYASINRVLTCG